ncbi:hypothetical protein [Bartonella pachyuromydis]|uniref:hypothetical protein n=1 Tax=Bartonella pachyuromydis TaxID=931097 RepID=UPI0031EAA893
MKLPNKHFAHITAQNARTKALRARLTDIYPAPDLQTSPPQTRCIHCRTKRQSSFLSNNHSTTQKHFDASKQSFCKKKRLKAASLSLDYFPLTALSKKASPINTSQIFPPALLQTFFLFVEFPSNISPHPIHMSSLLHTQSLQPNSHGTKLMLRPIKNVQVACFMG